MEIYEAEEYSVPEHFIDTRTVTLSMDEAVGLTNSSDKPKYDLSSIFDELGLRLECCKATLIGTVTHLELY